VIQHPERWNSQTTYYFYIDMGGVYHGIDDLSWLRGNKILTGIVFIVLYGIVNLCATIDRDSIIISELDDVEKLPKLSLNASKFIKYASFFFVGVFYFAFIKKN
jgi:hypothetical protein